MPDSYPNHAPLHSLPPIPHPGCFGGACRGPLVRTVVKRVVPLGLGSWVEVGLPTASRRRVGPLLEVQPIQQYNFKAANHLRIIPSNHTPESYAESYPRIIPPIQTYRPDFGKQIHTLYIYIYITYHHISIYTHIYIYKLFSYITGLFLVVSTPAC